LLVCGGVLFLFLSGQHGERMGFSPLFRFHVLFVIPLAALPSLPGDRRFGLDGRDKATRVPDAS
jgi:hypothetical protein